MKKTLTALTLAGSVVLGITFEATSASANINFEKSSPQSSKPYSNIRETSLGHTYPKLKGNNIESIGITMNLDGPYVYATYLGDNGKQKIISDVQVRFTSPEDTLVGESFISDPDLTNYEIRNAKGYSRRKVPLQK